MQHRIGPTVSVFSPGFGSQLPLGRDFVATPKPGPKPHQAQTGIMSARDKFLNDRCTELNTLTEYLLQNRRRVRVTFVAEPRQVSNGITIYNGNILLPNGLAYEIKMYKSQLQGMVKAKLRGTFPPTKNGKLPPPPPGINPLKEKIFWKAADDNGPAYIEYCSPNDAPEVAQDPEHKFRDPALVNRVEQLFYQLESAINPPRWKQWIHRFIRTLSQ